MTRPTRTAAAISCALAAACALVLAPAGGASVAQGGSGTGPRTPIEHVVYLMQENHSFDNYFGTYPGADGHPEGACMPYDPQRPQAGCVEPFHLGNRAVVDLAHSPVTHLAQYRDGRMDGFVSAFSDRADRGRLTMGYYDDRDLPFYWNVADEYVLFDRFFISAAGGSVTNHMYWVAGVPGSTGLREGIPPEGWGDIPTIFDRLQEKGISWKFYIQNYDPRITYRSPPDVAADREAQIVWAPVLAFARFLDDPDLFSRIVPLETYFDDLASGTLPAVSFMVPSGASEHPPGNLQAGERLVRTILNALMASEEWKSSAFLWTYDDWGGWYDHVSPPRVDEHGYGFRVPALLVSPYARRGHVDSTTLDFTSMLRFVEENWGVEPLAERDRRAKSFVSAFDFEQSPREPVFLSRERVVEAAPRPRRHVIYAGYSAALAIPVVLVLWAIGATRRRGGPGGPEQAEEATR